MPSIQSYSESIHAELFREYTELFTKYTELFTKYTELFTKYTELFTEYTELLIKYAELLLLVWRRNDTTPQCSDNWCHLTTLQGQESWVLARMAL